MPAILYMLHIYRSALMGLGDTVVPMFSGVAEMVVRIGVALLLPLALGQEGIYYAEVGAWTAAAVILVTAYYLRMNAPSPSGRAMPWMKNSEKGARLWSKRQNNITTLSNNSSSSFFPSLSGPSSTLTTHGHHFGGAVCEHLALAAVGTTTTLINLLLGFFWRFLLRLVFFPSFSARGDAKNKSARRYTPLWPLAWQAGLAIA